MKDENAETLLQIFGIIGSAMILICTIYLVLILSGFFLN